jgi:hypothetical protein
MVGILAHFRYNTRPANIKDFSGFFYLLYIFITADHILGAFKVNFWTVGQVDGSPVIHLVPERQPQHSAVLLIILYRYLPIFVIYSCFSNHKGASR